MLFIFTWEHHAIHTHLGISCYSSPLGNILLFITTWEHLAIHNHFGTSCYSLPLVIILSYCACKHTAFCQFVIKQRLLLLLFLQADSSALQFLCPEHCRSAGRPGSWFLDFKIYRQYTIEAPTCISTIWVPGIYSRPGFCIWPSFYSRNYGKSVINPSILHFIIPSDNNKIIIIIIIVLLPFWLQTSNNARLHTRCLTQPVSHSLSLSYSLYLSMSLCFWLSVYLAHTLKQWGGERE